MQLGAPATAMRELQELLAYWGNLRLGSRLPRREDINPCGFKGLRVTQLKDFGVSTTTEQIEQKLAQNLIILLQQHYVGAGHACE